MAKKQKKKQKIFVESEISKKELWLKITGVTISIFGLFLFASLVSYLFTWKNDQSLLLSSESTYQFLFKDKEGFVKNWAGRSGAAASHLLFYKSLGLVSLIFAGYITIIGIKILNPKLQVHLKTWHKILAFSILFIAPVLRMLFPNTAINLGGALGVQTTDWIQGFAGDIGNILLFTAIGFLFYFYVFNLKWPKFLKFSPKKIKQQILEEKVDTNLDTLNESSLDIAEEVEKEESEVLTATTSTASAVEGNIEEKQSPRQELELEIDEGDIDEQEAIEGMELIIKTKDGETTQSATSINEHYAQQQAAQNAREQEETTEKTNTQEPIVLELPEEKEAKADQEIKVEQAQQKLGNEEEFEITISESFSKQPQHGDHISIEDKEPYDPSLELRNYKFPTLDLLTDYNTSDKPVYDKQELENNKDQIVGTLKSFGIEIQKIKATVGPTVTLYEIIPAEGVRISKIKNLEDDIALSLAALGIRIIAPIPGKGTIGIEVPNTNKQLVGMKSMLSSDKFVNNKMILPIALGKTIDNQNFIVDLATMPHLLMAGATGQGKSVGINAILVSLLYKKHPSQLKFVMVDPKKVELSIYREIEKHYLAKLPNEEEAIITDVNKVVSTLKALGIEMDNRYELLKDARARNIKEYNTKFINRELNPKNGHKYLPYIVLVIDEFADLIMTAGKEIETPIARLAQLARAIGIHLIIATQRPSVNVITGIIKANFPGRIAFKVSAKVDSRTILDATGADQLIGKGDMLFSQGSDITRIQCAFVDTPEVERIVDFIGEQRGYPTAFELPEVEDENEDGGRETDITNRDALFNDCAELVVQSGSGSTSMLQRRFNIGYNRAGRIMDQLEAVGIVGPQIGSKPREVIALEGDLQGILDSLP